MSRIQVYRNMYWSCKRARGVWSQVSDRHLLVAGLTLQFAFKGPKWSMFVLCYQSCPEKKNQAWSCSYTTFVSSCFTIPMMGMRGTTPSEMSSNFLKVPQWL